MEEPDAYTDIERRVAELRRLKARKPESLRRQFYLTAGLLNAIGDMELSEVQDAAEWLADYFADNDIYTMVNEVFDCEELTEDEWSSYHSADVRGGTRPLSHDPVRGDSGSGRSGKSTEVPVQARAF